MQPRLAVFDFDQTLAVADVNGAELGNAIEMMGGSARLEELKTMFSQLSDDHGIESAIVSFNNKETITEALRSTGLLRYFEDETANLTEADAGDALEKARVQWNAE